MIQLLLSKTLFGKLKRHPNQRNFKQREGFLLDYSQKTKIIFFFLSLFFLSSQESFGQSYTKTNIPHTIAALSNPIRVYDGAYGSYDDTYSAAISLPFNFQFFGRSVSQFYLSTNGIMFFSNPSTRYIASSIPTADDVNDMIAVWNDLYVVSGTGHYVQHKTVGTAPNRVLIVDYNVAYFSDHNASARFQFKLHEGSNIIEQHVSILSYGATVGIENVDGTEGYGTNYTSGVTNFAYRYTPSNTNGALTLAADSVTGLPGTQVVVPVKVSDFRNIVTAQGSINFNPSVASFVGVEQLGLPNLSSANFGTSQAGNGTVTFSWDDQTLAGVSLTDNATIFALRFNVTGAAGSRTPVSFINTPTPVEFTDAAFTTRNAILNNGQISVPVNYITTSPISGNTFCGGSTVNVAFTAGGVYNAGNTFTAQLSDANGSFNAPLTIGSGSQSPITATLPVTASGSSYRIRVVSSSPFIIGTDNGSNIAITSAPASPTATGGAICGFGSVTLSASGAPAGGSYRWYTTASGGMPISGATSATYTTPYLTATTTYYVAAVNSSGCESTRTPATATINAIPTAPAVAGNGTSTTFTLTSPSDFETHTQAIPTAYNISGLSINNAGSAQAHSHDSATPITIKIDLFDADRSTWVNVYTNANVESNGFYLEGLSISFPSITRVTQIRIDSNPYQYNSFHQFYSVPVTLTSPATASNCGPGSVTLSASGAPAGGSYRWYTTASGGMPISGATSATYTTPYLTATTTYYVAAVNSSGCESTRTPATASINAIPTAPAITSNSPVAEGGTLNLTASSVTGAIYNWTGPNGFTSQSQNPVIYNITAANAGTYNLTVTVNGCTSTPVSTHVSLLYTISGTIQSETGSPINGVTVSASDGTATQSMVTSGNGSYSFDLAQANMHTISPVKNNDVVMNNGITTSDIALIRRHILGIADLPSPYKILAADVDYSSNVTTADIAQIRSIVLAINNSFPNGRNWAFVPSNYIFADPTNPFPFASESYLYSNLTTSLTNQDFIGLKLGDVNNTWDNTVARLASFGHINVELPQRQVQQNTEISVPVRFSDFKDISGYQFTLEWDSKVLEFIGTENGALTAAYGTHRTAEGKLTTTWDDQQGTSMSLSDTATVFNLKFRVKGAPGTFSPLVVSSALTKAEAYNGQLKQMRVNSSVGQVQVKRLQEDMLPGGYTLYQSYPNPAIGSVYIAFDLPENQDVEITLYTTLGQKVNYHRGNYPAGEHRVQFDVSKLAAGTYLYQITAGSFAQAKRMVVIK